ncbi:MAG TPA: FAD binding domain-containing protein [Pseudonocardia sp.]|jgi:CO/xanthine dehydrogenase FAD-binding subunit|nr:FAD binding domain-containing protein [Pseudonocardia sp.]
MDLHTVTVLHRPADRAELAGRLGPGAAPLAGGTWMFSQPQLHLHTLVDLTGLGWPALRVTDAGLEIAATCTLAELAAFAAPPGWPAAALARSCCEALAGSFKIWHTATVGGNICLGLPAGPMTSLAAALDGELELWPASGPARRVPVTEFVRGDRRTALRPGEVLRAVHLPVAALVARTAFRRAALATQGRSGAVVIGRRDPAGGFVLTVTAATDRPRRLAFARLPTAAELATELDRIETWFDDPHGAPDWRRAVTLLLADQIRADLRAELA